MDFGLISKYWEKQFREMRSDSSYWLNNLIVQSHVNKLMTGEDRHWLNWLLGSYFKNKHFDSSLSICCGDGAHELILSKSNQVGFVHGVDLSKGAIGQAMSSFDLAGIKPESYLFEVKDINEIKEADFNRKYDLVMSTGAMHHIKELEKVIDTVKRILKKDGYFVIVEYIGPKKFQWTDKQVSMINGILKSIDQKYLRGKDIVFGRPTLEEMDKIDPSEAVRSDEIYDLVKENFDVEYEKMFNGTIVHQLHPILNSKLPNKGNKDFDSLIRLILLMEDKLIRSGFIKSDFVFMVLKNKPDPLKQ